MAIAECGIRENLAKYYRQKNSPARLEGVGREAGQTPILLVKSGRRKLAPDASSLKYFAARLFGHVYASRGGERMSKPKREPAKIGEVDVELDRKSTRLNS